MNPRMPGPGRYLACRAPLSGQNGKIPARTLRSQNWTSQQRSSELDVVGEVLRAGLRWRGPQGWTWLERSSRLDSAGEVLRTGRGWRGPQDWTSLETSKPL